MNKFKLNKETYILFIGAPGVGKGTYSSLLSEDLGIRKFSTGDKLRDIVKQQKGDSKTLDYVKKTMNEGKLVDKEIIFEKVREEIEKEESKNGLLLDGFPRNIEQAVLFSALKNISLVVKIELRTDILIKKLKGRRVCGSCGKNYNVSDIKDGEYVMEPLLPKTHNNICDNCHGTLVQRKDDTEEVIKERLKIFEEMNDPLENYYREKGIVENFEPKKGIKDYPILRDLTMDRLSRLGNLQLI